MKPLTLKVRDGDTDRTYSDDRLDASRIVVEERVRDLDVEVGDVAVRVHDAVENGEVTDRFLALDPTDLSAGQYRAQLVGEDGTVVFDGEIRTADLEYEEETATWTVVLRQQAQERFWDQDIDIRTVDLSAVSSTDIEMYVIPDLQGDENAGLGGQVYNISRGRGGGPEVLYEPVELLQEILNTLGISWTIPNELWPHAVNRFGTVPRLEGLYATLGNYSSRDWIETITKAAGWRVTVTYEDYPSLDLHASFQPIDGRTGGYEPRTEYEYRRRSYEQKPAQVLQWANPGRSIKPTEYETTQSGDAYFFDSQPPAFGRIATDRWRAKPPAPEPYSTGSRTIGFRDEDPRQMKGEVTDVDIEYMPVAVSPNGGVDTRTNDGRDEEVAYGPALIKASTVDTLRLALVYDDGGSERFPVVHSITRFEGPVETDEQTFSYNAGWAQMPFQQQQQRRGFQAIVERVEEGRVGLEDVSDVRPYQIEYDANEDVTTVEARGFDAVTYADRPGVTIPWEVEQLDGRLHKTEYTGDLQYWIQAWWARTRLSDARELYYKAQVRVDDENYSGSNRGEWIDVTPRGGAATFPNRIYATSFSGLSVFFADGSYYTPSPGSGVIRCRVRPLTQNGETIGAWKETQIYRDDE